MVSTLARTPPRARPPASLGLESVVGNSASLRQLCSQVEKVARSEATTVLILGESGVGKDLLARVIHSLSPRAEGPFLPINCSAVPENLLESEFFGHEQGAFTDARGPKCGLFELADGGTLFLDEVGELAPGMQAKLLRFLEERSFLRVGGLREVSVDVRVIAATNQDLTRAVAEGRFRSDLYYRLQVVPLWVPPLRERAEDVPLLAHHFLEHLSRRLHKRFVGFEPMALRRLQEHSWPGNVRELKNVLERVVLLEEGVCVTAEMLVLVPAPRSGGSASGGDAAEAAEPAADDLNIDHLQLQSLVRALERAAGNQSEAARLLGVSRDTVRSRMKKHGVRVEVRVLVVPRGVTGAGAPVPSPRDRGCGGAELP